VISIKDKSSIYILERSRMAPSQLEPCWR